MPADGGVYRGAGIPVQQTETRRRSPVHSLGARRARDERGGSLTYWVSAVPAASVIDRQVQRTLRNQRLPGLWYKTCIGAIFVTILDLDQRRGPCTSATL